MAKRSRLKDDERLAFLEKVKRTAITAMFLDDDLMDRLVLKGGNLLDIVLGISTRSSVDIDFSVDGDLGKPGELQPRIENCLRRAFHEIGYDAFDVTVTEVPPQLTHEMKEFWGGYQVAFKIIEKELGAELVDNIEERRRNAAAVGDRSSTKFGIDISKHEYCESKEMHTLDHVTIYGYSPIMVIAEKLRAICQQMPEYRAIVRNNPSARARDFVDIHRVCTMCGVGFSEDDAKQIVRRVFAAKRVPLHLIGQIANYREYHRPDFVAVRATVKSDVTLEEFDFYYDFVVEQSRHLEILWHI